MKCGVEGDWLCCDCRHAAVDCLPFQVCPACLHMSKNGLVCPDCQGKWDCKGLLVLFCSSEFLRKIIHQYKYAGICDLDIPISQMVFDAGFRGGDFDLVTAVPLTRTREMWRGYNQSRRLARLLSKKMGVEYIDVLQRKGKSRAQVFLDKNMRRKNVEGVFGLRVLGQVVKNKKILIVDDVCTTGATINECAKVLKESGAELVFGLVLVRGI